MCTERRNGEHRRCDVDAVSLHADATAVLLAYPPADAKQAALRTHFLDFLAAHPEAMTRECRPAHLTGSAVILDPTGTRVLLNLHRKARLWLHMGGHCEDGDTTVAETALREAREESGIDALRLLPGPVMLDRHPAPCSPDVEHHLDVMYVALAPADAVAEVSEESLQLGWFAVDAVPEPTDDALRELVAVATERVRREVAADARSDARSDAP